MTSDAVKLAREETNRELVKSLTHPALLFVGGVYAINWMADRPGGMGQAQAAALEALLAGVCAGSAIAPAFPELVKLGGDVVKGLLPALGTAALIK